MTVQVIAALSTLIRLKTYFSHIDYTCVVYPQSFQTQKASFIFGNTIKIFWMKPGGLWLSHWLPSNKQCQGPEKYEDIDKIVCHQWFNRNLWSYKKAFWTQRKQNNNFIQQFVSSVSPLLQRSAILECHDVFYICLCFDLNENLVSVLCGWYRTAYTVCVQRILSKMALRWRFYNQWKEPIRTYYFFICTLIINNQI